MSQEKLGESSPAVHEERDSVKQNKAQDNTRASKEARAHKGKSTETNTSNSESLTTAHSFPDSEEAALTEHNSILECLTKIDRDWVSVAERIREFTKSKYFKLIQNPKTGKRFTRASDWVQFVTGQCASAFYRDQQILRELGGLVSSDKVAVMSRENAKHLIKQKKAGNKIDAVLVEEATQEEAAEFQIKHPVKEAAGSEEGLHRKPAMRNVQFSMDNKDLQQLRKALKRAKQDLRSVDRKLRDSAGLAKLATFYLEHCGAPLSDIPPLVTEQPEAGTAVVM